MRRVAVPAALALLGLASVAQAHPKLVAASPGPNATVAKPARVELRFTEKLMPRFSGADLMTTGVNGANHPPVKVASASAVGGDCQTLVIMPNSPQRRARDSVAWHVVSVDTHRVAGTLAFAVK